MCAIFDRQRTVRNFCGARLQDPIRFARNIAQKAVEIERGVFLINIYNYGLLWVTPHGGVRPFNRKSTCITQLTLEPYGVQIWSRNPRISEATKPANSTVRGRLLWITMIYYGFTSSTSLHGEKDYYGSLWWITLGYYGSPRWITMDYYGSPWLITMNYYGLLWVALVDHYGLLWITMDYYGLLWTTLDLPRAPPRTGRRAP